MVSALIVRTDKVTQPELKAFWSRSKIRVYCRKISAIEKLA